VEEGHIRLRVGSTCGASNVMNVITLIVTLRYSGFLDL